MKHDMDHLNLRNAFPQEPESCHQALMRAARSVKEDEPVKKTSFRVVLIAAAIIAATMAVAVAAGKLLGWPDYFSQQYGTAVPDSARRIMSEESNRHTFTLGPATFVTQELFCDGHLTMSSTEISITDDSDALVCSEPFDTIGAIGENGDQMAERLGVESDLTWIEAAKTLNRKLYSVRAILELPAGLDGGTAMEDTLWNEEGHVVYFSMPFLKGKPASDTVDMQMYLRVAEIDVENETETNVLSNREAIRLGVAAPIAEHTYEIGGGFVAGGYRLEEVKAELSPAGLYLTSTFTAPEGVTKDDESLHNLPEWLDAEGLPFPLGVSLSADVDVENLPTVVYTQMFSVDAIPERMSMELSGETLELTLDN